MSGRASTFYPDNVKPCIGDTLSSAAIGRAGGRLYRWSACPACAWERWASKTDSSRLCTRCAAIQRQMVGERNPRWNGGVRKAGGYNYITVYDDHPLIYMATKVMVHGKNRYCIAEHRLVMAQHLGRPLEPWELVHHKNGIKDDNRIENLEMLSRKEHQPSVGVQLTIKRLQSRVTILEAEVALLRSLVSGSRDGGMTGTDTNHHNTPSSCVVTEGIVHSLSNEGDNE